MRKSNYISKRKLFDSEVQRAKRKHRFSMQTDLVNECNLHDVTFWKTIGKIGVGQNRKRPIPMEVVLDDGSTSNDTQNVLNNQFYQPFSMSIFRCLK